VYFAHPLATVHPQSNNRLRVRKFSLVHILVWGIVADASFAFLRKRLVTILSH
jgi:hypothetical protein